MPVQLQIDGGEHYLPFAKKRLAALEEQLVRQELRTGTRHYKLDDAEIEVHVSIPVDVASGKPRPERAQNRIRIAGAGGNAEIYWLPSQASFYPKYSMRIKLLEEGGDQVFSTGQILLSSRLLSARVKEIDAINRERLMRGGDEHSVRSLTLIVTGRTLFSLDGRVLYASSFIPCHRISDGVQTPAMFCGGGEAARHFFVAKYRDILRVLRDGTFGMAHVRTLSSQEIEVALTFGSYQYQYQVNVSRGVPGAYTINEPISGHRMAVTTVKQAEAVNISVGLVQVAATVEIELERVTGSITVDDDGRASVALTPKFAVYVGGIKIATSPTGQLSFMRLDEVETSYFDVGSLFNISEDFTFTTNDNASSDDTPQTTTRVKTAAVRSMLSYGAVVFIRDKSTVREDYAVSESSPAPADFPCPGTRNDYSNGGSLTNTIHRAEAYRIQIAPPLGYEVTPIPIVLCEDWNYSDAGIDYYNPPTSSRQYTHSSGSINRPGRTWTLFKNDEEVAFLQNAGLAGPGVYEGNSVIQEKPPLSNDLVTIPSPGIQTPGDSSVACYRDALIKIVVPAEELPDGQYQRFFLYGEEIEGPPLTLDPDNDDRMNVLTHEFAYAESGHQYALDCGGIRPALFGEGAFASTAHTSVSAVQLPANFVRVSNEMDWLTNVSLPQPTSDHVLAVFWPGATAEREGVCILQVQGESSYSAFHALLKTAIDAKRGGLPYEDLLQNAIAMLTYKINNFASWDLVSKFQSPGRYYIAT